MCTDIGLFHLILNLPNFLTAYGLPSWELQNVKFLYIQSNSLLVIIWYGYQAMSSDCFKNMVDYIEGDRDYLASSGTVGGQFINPLHQLVTCFCVSECPNILSPEFLAGVIAGGVLLGGLVVLFLWRGVVEVLDRTQTYNIASVSQMKIREQVSSIPIFRS